MQTFDIYLGYDFSWYLRGPYCSRLATCGFALGDIYTRIPDGEKAEFAGSDIQVRFKKFSKIIHPHIKDVDFLEIAASLHYLQKTCEMKDEEMIDKVAKKQERFTKEQVRKINEEIKKWPLI